MFSRPKPDPQAEPRAFVWSVEIRDLKAMAISVPHQGKSEAWVKREDQHEALGRGGGIPLLLSGPRAERLQNEDTIHIEVGDRALDRQAADTQCAYGRNWNGFQRPCGAARCR